MCVVALALNTHPNWRLVVVGNRDEFHARPTSAVARWDGEDDHIIAGRDLQSGGTWLGVSERGHLAVVTNIRTGQPPDTTKLSRGVLISGFLRGAAILDGDLECYNPFSLFALGSTRAHFAANRPAPAVDALRSGIHSLSNGLPGQEWPRRHRVHNGLADWITRHAKPEELLDLLADETPLSADRGHTPIFIRDDSYGTRCSTVVTVDHEGQGTIIERRFGPAGRPGGETVLHFRWPHALVGA